MSEINQQGSNPLQKYFRQPKLYISLPSKGKFYPNGAYENTESGELPVFSMTAKDELTFKTPDALLNGQATVDVIQSCIPNIKNAWAMPSIDLDACLIAIRMATYGEEMGITIKKPVTGEESEMNVDLRGIMDHFSDAEYVDSITVGDMIVGLRPLTYKEFTQNALKTFEEQRIFNIVNDESIEDDVKLQAFTNSFVKLTSLTVNMISTGITSIQVGDDVVDNRKHIDEFIANADKQFFNSITEHLNKQKESFSVKPLTVTSTPEDIELGVPATYDVPITFDQSNFFA
jgi:hypothetical protein